MRRGSRGTRWCTGEIVAALLGPANGALQRLPLDGAAAGLPRIRHYGLLPTPNRAEKSRKPRTPQRRSACRRPARAAGYRHGHATCDALLQPALCGRMIVIEVVRTRPASRGGSDAQQGRHIMSQTALSVATSRSDALARRRQRSLSTRSTRSTYRAPVDPFERLRDAYYTLRSRQCADPRPHPVGVTSTLELGAAIKSHSARCITGAQLPATSCLGAFWTPAPQRVEVPHADVQNLHINGTWSSARMI